MDTPVRAVATLVPGDSYEYHWTGVRVTVLRAPESHVDIFGRDCQKVWAQRSDTGAEGWLVYGLDAKVWTS